MRFSKLFLYIFVIISFLILMMYFISSLEFKLFTSIKKICGKQTECIINLYEATPFKWDKAYFFEKSNNYEIQKNIGINYKFNTDIGDQIVFVRKNKIIAYQTINGNYEFLYKENLFAFFSNLFSRVVNKKNIIIRFEINTQTFNHSKYFNKPVNIYYYLITPTNDKLQVCFYKNNTKQIYSLSPTNLHQVQLVNPKIDH